jgi:hypothetical protein
MIKLRHHHIHLIIIFGLIIGFLYILVNIIDKFIIKDMMEESFTPYIRKTYRPIIRGWKNHFIYWKNSWIRYLQTTRDKYFR